MTLTQAKLYAAMYPTKENIQRVQRLIARRRQRKLAQLRIKL